MAVGLVPSRLKARLYRLLLGWDIDPTALIGFSLFIGVEHVHIGAHAQIGHFNVFRNLTGLSVGEHAEIGQFNWLSAGKPFLAGASDGGGSARIGDHAAITSRHYVDCSGGVEIGDFALLAGVRSVVLTHFIDVETCRQRVARVHVRERTILGSNVTILPGADVPARSQVAAGAVVRGVVGESGKLYAGVPARTVRGVHGRFFDRTVGHVDP